MRLSSQARPLIVRNLGSLAIALTLWLLANLAHKAEDRYPVLGLLYDLEASLVDLRFEWRGQRALSDQVVIVAIDSKSVERRGRWPWTRHDLAALVDVLGQAEARVVAFDILFSEPEIACDDDPDDVLATAMAAGPKVILPYRWLGRGESRESWAVADPPGFEPAWLEALRSKGSLGGEGTLPRDCPRAFPFGSTPLVDRLTEASAGLGFANNPKDRHGKARSAWLTRVYSRSTFDLFPAGPDEPSGEERKLACDDIEDVVTLVSLPAAAIAAYLELSLTDLHLDPRGFLQPNPAASSHPATPETDVPIPWLHSVDPTDHTILIDYYGSRKTFQTYSYLDVMECEAEDNRCLTNRGGRKIGPAEAFAGKLVFVGLTDPGSFDSFPTPTDSDLSGVEMHATVAQNLLDGRQLSYARDEFLQTALVSLLAALMAALLICNLGTLPATLVLVTVAAVFARFTLADFSESASLWNWTIPLLTLVSTHALVSIFCALHENQHRRRQHSAFIRYLSKPAIDAILADPSEVRIGRQERDATVVFLDPADFEDIARQASNRRVLINPLNSYLDQVIQVFLGTADDTIIKIFGHGVMAVFICADHEARACRAAQRLPGALTKLQPRFESEGLLAQGLACRIGISSGEVVIGNVGSRRFVDYTVIGESVEEAHRLQQTSLELELEILVSATTRTKAREIDSDLVFQTPKSHAEDSETPGYFELIGRPAGTAEPAPLRRGPISRLWSSVAHLGRWIRDRWG